MNLLSKLYTINCKSEHEEEMTDFILLQLEKIEHEGGFSLEIESDAMGNLFITKGESDSYPCVVAHTDEVHIPRRRNVCRRDGMIYTTNEAGEQVGCGADDKNGIWIALRMLERVPSLKVALFVQEETGCHGSKGCDMSFFADCRYLLQCDRKGASDLVVCGKGVPLCDDDFIPAHLLEQYGYSPVEGGRTDVVALKEKGLRQPCCNISCGYYNAHHDDEYTIEAELENALEFVYSIVTAM